jgi:hypothetical protein
MVAPMSASIRLRRASLVLALVSTTLFVPAERATAQTPPCESVQAQAMEPAPEFTTAAAGSRRAHDWLRLHPMPITSLVASLPDPPKSVVDRYLGTFGANAAHLWKDGPPQVQGWLGHRPGMGYLTWLENNGNSSVWNGSQFVDSGSLLGGLPPDNPGRIGYQVGDEPTSVAAMNEINNGISRIRAYRKRWYSPISATGCLIRAAWTRPGATRSSRPT